MDVYMLLESYIASLQDNLPLAAAAGLLFVILLFRKPKLALSLVIVVALLLGILMFISSLSLTGAGHKSKMTTSGMPPD